MSNDQVAHTTAFEDNSALPPTNDPIDQTQVTNDPQANPLKPVEDVAPGIASVADFLPSAKDAPTSHPTPPPDEPLVSAEANVDVEMTEAGAPAAVAEPAPEVSSEVVAESVEEPAAVPVPAPVTESSLVRPREDDGEDEEPAAKRSKVGSVDASGAEDVSLPAADPVVESEPQKEPQKEQSSIPTDAPAPVESAPADPLPSSVAQLEPQPSEATDAPSEVVSTTAPVNGTSAEADTKPPIDSIESQAAPSTENNATPSIEPSQPDTQPQPSAASIPAPAAASSSAASSASSAKYSTKPMTIPQKNFLVDKMKNLKKTKSSGPFLNPVDWNALNIPSYPEIIKQPMDLGTMEQKLKAGRYTNVQEFADDFDLIINNVRTFNGPAHAVTQMGNSMEAYFRKMMESVPSADLPVIPKKKASPKPAPVQRREPRAVAPPTPTANAAESFALQTNGLPQIRRESTANRPARAIKPPPAKELQYALPKRKEHQLELKFAEHVLEEIRGPKYAAQNSVFLAPVDPVALNIPNYRQIVKHPMDLGTMTQKMKQGLYGKASDVKKDFDLMIENCILFNPMGNPVRDMGVALQRHFENLWRGKDKWEKIERANAQRGVSSAEEESEEEEEDDEDDASDEKSQTIRALQKQLMDMQNALAGLNAPSKKAKKPKTAKQGSTKKSGGGSTKQKLPPAKPKTNKKTKQVSYEEKQEISEAVGNMNGAQVEQLTNIITSNCKKYAEQDEMELEIDDLPNEVQFLLLQYVRSIFGNPNKRARQASPEDAGEMEDDDEFAPQERGSGKRGGGGGGKRKKHKPMGKKEQQDAINNIQKQLAQFSNAGAEGQSVGGGYASQQQDHDSSGDEESEESEEE
jgi:bromodomain-containing factor 1